MDITELAPERVFYWFNEICKIPHGSGNTEKLSRFCADFAAERGLRFHRDELGNVIIFKDALHGRENREPVILQGHLDMVCDKTADSSADMAKEGIIPLIDGEYITAQGTTLGADDGIAIAYILSILEADDIPHPAIEAVFTVDEEIGLIGANGLDCSVLSGRRLINIDSEEEGILTVGCAGGVRVSAEIPVSFVPVDMSGSSFVRLSVSGLAGGHSGIEINKHRKNAITILGRLLDRLAGKYEIGICSLFGGGKMNIIPHDACAVIKCRCEDAEVILAETADFYAFVKEECRVTEPAVVITAEKCSGAEVCTDKSSTKSIIFTLMNAPHGVVEPDPEIEGMVLSSLNLGTASVEDDELLLSFFVRSNNNVGKQVIVERLLSFVGFLGGEVCFDSDYPAWEYNSVSPLRDTMADVYRKMYGREPIISAIHAGLECGILSAKIKEPDMISFGPDIENAHTPAERLNISSARRCYEYLIEVLKELN